MKETFEKLWNDYFYEECAVIDTEEERALIRKTAETHEKLNRILTNEQNEMLEKYIEVLYENQGLYLKKGFFKGCKFAISFILEVGDNKN